VTVSPTLEHLLAVVEGNVYDYTPTSAERELAEGLIALEQEEEEVSALRRKLHDRLSSFASSTTEARERRVSAHRTELHWRIDLFRSQLAELGWVRTTVGKGRTGRSA
jgi:hypothetical protein